MTTTKKTTKKTAKKTTIKLAKPTRYLYGFREEGDVLADGVKVGVWVRRTALVNGRQAVYSLSVELPATQEAGLWQFACVREGLVQRGRFADEFISGPRTETSAALKKRLRQAIAERLA